MRNDLLPLATRKHLADRGFCEIPLGSREVLFSAARESDQDRDDSLVAFGSILTLETHDGSEWAEYDAYGND